MAAELETPSKINSENYYKIQPESSIFCNEQTQYQNIDSEEISNEITVVSNTGKSSSKHETYAKDMDFEEIDMELKIGSSDVQEIVNDYHSYSNHEVDIVSYREKSIVVESGSKNKENDVEPVVQIVNIENSQIVGEEPQNNVQEIVVINIENNINKVGNCLDIVSNDSIKKQQRSKQKMDLEDTFQDDKKSGFSFLDESSSYTSSDIEEIISISNSKTVSKVKLNPNITKDIRTIHLENTLQEDLITVSTEKNQESICNELNNLEISKNKVLEVQNLDANITKNVSQIQETYYNTKAYPQFEYAEALNIPFIIDVNSVNDMQHNNFQNPETTFSLKNPEEVLDIVDVYQRVHADVIMAERYIEFPILPFSELKDNTMNSRKFN